MLQAAVRHLAHRAGLLVDTVIPATTGHEHVRTGNHVYTLHHRLPGEAATWQQWPALQRQPRVPEALGGLQALWDTSIGRTRPAELLDAVPVTEWPLVAGRGDVHRQLTDTFIRQIRPGPRLDLTGTTNADRIDWAAGIADQHAVALPRFAALYGRWRSRLRDWAAEFDHRPVSASAMWLQHGDPSPTNTFFRPRLRSWRHLAGIIDFELVRFAALRSDLGVAASLRLADTPTPTDLARIHTGQPTAARLDLQPLQRYLTGYLSLAIDTDLTGQEVHIGLRANVLGLALWSVRMAEAGILDDEQLADYVATQLHRYLARCASPPAEIDQAIDSARSRAASIRPDIQAALAPAAVTPSPRRRVTVRGG